MIHRMEAKIYKFGDFCLNPVARELSRDGEPLFVPASAFDCLVYLIEHRERPIGKDELISAVWGRTDVSENLLAQTIVRLRRTLGDVGDEQQRCIKTIARVGYRWMLDTTVTFGAPASVKHDSGVEPYGLVSEAAGDVDDGDAIGILPHVRPVRRYLFVALILALVLAAGYAGEQRLRPKKAQATIHFNKSAAIVLPVEVNAPEDWKWLHFGLMDLISTRLHEAKIPTETSQAVLELLKERADASGEGLSSFALVIRPHVELADNRWRVHLDARSQDGHTWRAESSSSDVLEASRAASDLLLAQLGYAAGASGPRVASDSQLEYMQRIDAARLAGQPYAARELIDMAPPDLRNKPELAYTVASLDCDEGKKDSCEQRLSTLLKQLTDKKQEPVLRGEILTKLGMIYSDKNQDVEGEAKLTEALHTLQKQKDTEALANAYLDHSYVEQMLWRLDDATSDLGLARVNYALSGDAVGAAKADFEMGLLAERRAQPEAAVSLLQNAYDQFHGMGMRSMLPSTLDGLAYAQQMLLKFTDELGTTDRFWPVNERDFGFIDAPMRRELTMVRAIALADNGRTSEAATFGELIVNEADPKNDAAQIAETNKLLARVALDQGNNERAASLASKALTPALAEGDRRDYAETWLIRISALQRAGKADEAKHDVSAMVEWETHLSVKDDWTHIYVIRAIAAQYWIEGNHDKAVDQFKLAMASAEKLGVPEVIVSVGKSYALMLLDIGHLDQAIAVSGSLSMWSDTDWRAAWVEARVYQALGQTSSWEKSRNKAEQLAGDRLLHVGASSDYGP